MVELSWYQNNSMLEERKKLWYVRPVTKQMLSIHEMAQHMAEHNTPFSAGTIEGILTDFSKCIHEQLLNGNSVKIDNLAIFKISVESHGFDNLGGIDTKTGRVMAAAKYGAAVKSAKLLAIATGDFVREKLNQNVEYGWDTETQAKIESIKASIKKEIAELEAIGAKTVEEQTGVTPGEGKPAATDTAAESDSAGKE